VLVLIRAHTRIFFKSRIAKSHGLLHGCHDIVVVELSLVLFRRESNPNSAVMRELIELIESIVIDVDKPTRYVGLR
jgi:hypothetical protein